MRRPGSPERDRYLFRPGAAGGLAAEQLAVRFRRPRLDPRAARRRVVPAPVRSPAARSELAQPGGRRRRTTHPAVLAGPRGGRIPHRRRARPGEGRGLRDNPGRRARRFGVGDEERTPTISPRCMTSTDGGGRCSTATPATGRHRRGLGPRAAALARYVRPDECIWPSISLPRRLGAGAIRGGDRYRVAVLPPGTPATWVLSNHDVRAAPPGWAVRNALAPPPC